MFLSFALVFGVFGMDTAGAFAAASGSGSKNSGFGAMRFSASSAQELSLDSGSITITAAGYFANGSADITNYQGPYLITQTGSSTPNTITVQGGKQNITIESINIDASTADQCAFAVTASAEVDLTLEGNNRLKSGSQYAGLQVEGGNKITISGTDSDRLTANSGTWKGAGIGGSEDGGGNIIINGGNITAVGLCYGAGIGGGHDGGDSTITIKGGNVTATGGFGAGIGGGYQGGCGTVAISGEDTQVHAGGNNGGRDIGSGSSSGDGGTLSVAGNSPDNGPTVELKSAGTNAERPNNVPYQFANCKIWGSHAVNAQDIDISGYYNGWGEIMTDVELTASPNTPAPLGSISLSAKVTKHGFPNAAVPVGSGLVTFSSRQGAASQPPIVSSIIPVDSTGTALSQWKPGAGAYTVMADYISGVAYAEASCSISYKVQKATPAVSLDASSAPLAGGSATLTATVTGIPGFAPTGNVTFSDEYGALGTAALSGGKAAFSWNSVPGGIHTLTAAYSGDGNYINAASTGLPYNISKKDQAPLSVTGVPPAVEYGGRGFHLNAAGGSGSGGWSYSANGSSASVDASGNVMITGVGDTTIFVIRDGDGIYNPKQSTVIVHVVKGTPKIKTALSASAVSGSQLSAASVSGEMVNASDAAVPGAFSWAQSDTAVTASGNYDAVFTPDDRTDYNTISVPVTVTVTPVPTPQSNSGGSSHGTTTPSLPSSLTDTPTSTTADLSGAAFPAWVTGVSLSVNPEASGNTSSASNAGIPADPQGAAVYHLVISQTDLNLIGSPFVYNIKLLDQNGNPIPSFTGTVTVKVAIPAGIHGTPHIFRYEESTGTFTDLNATVENGFLVFQTNHFSYYVIAAAGDSVTLDTKNYQLPVGGKYQIGVKLTGSKAASMKVYSTNDKVAAAARLKNGNVQVTGKGVGTAYIMIDVYDGKNHLLTHASVKIDVKTGIRPRGDSARQIGVF